MAKNHRYKSSPYTCRAIDCYPPVTLGARQKGNFYQAYVIYKDQKILGKGQHATAMGAMESMREMYNQKKQEAIREARLAK